MKISLPILSAAVAAMSSLVVPSFAAMPAGAASPGDQVAMLESVTYKSSEVIKLWPGTAPGERGTFGPEHVLPDRARPFDQITNVTVPTLSVFLPSPEKNTGTAVLVIPGGGLQRLAIEHEGYEIAEWLNSKGIAAFVLKYRVPFRDPQQRWKVGVQDAQRAMGIIRSRAADWRIDADSLGTIGFSAGGEINVVLAVYHKEPRQYDPIDAADTFSTRPDFNIVMYGGGFANGRDNTLRADIASRIDKTTPPMFIAHAFDDSALTSVILMGALKRAEIPSELHIFGAGGHGFGIRGTGLPVGHWSELCLNWMAWQGYMDNAQVRKFARDYAKARASGAATLPRFGSLVPKADLGQAFAAQRRVLSLKDGSEVAGYTGAFTTAAAQKAVKLTHPAHGVLLKANRLDAKAGTPVAVSSKQPLLIGTQIGYVMETDIGTKLVVPRQAITNIRAIVPVVELPHDVGSVKRGLITGNALDVVAENVGANKFIVGAPIPAATVGSTDALAVTLNRGGQKVHAATGADAKDGQARMLMTLINQIIDQGRVVRSGDIILSGPLGGLQPGEKGSYDADFGKLGKVAFAIE